MSRPRTRLGLFLAASLALGLPVLWWASPALQAKSYLALHLLAPEAAGLWACERLRRLGRPGASSLGAIARDKNAGPELEGLTLWSNPEIEAAQLEVFRAAPSLRDLRISLAAYTARLKERLPRVTIQAV